MRTREHSTIGVVGALVVRFQPKHEGAEDWLCISAVHSQPKDVQMRRLIVNADDIGLCTGTVTGILHGHRRGIITSTSVMFTTPASSRAVEVLRDHPSLDVGVHLTFVEGRPVLAADWVPSLLNGQGRFLTPLEWRTSGRRPDLKELRAEWRAQIALALGAGLRISHLDLHTHVGYLLPEVFELHVNLAAEYRLAMRFPFGEGWEAMGTRVAAQVGLPPDAIMAMLRQYRELVVARKVPHPDRFVDAFPDMAACDGGALAHLISTLGEGTSEILTHPAFEAGCKRYLGDRAKKRAAELAALCDPRVKQAIEREGIELVSFRELRNCKALDFPNRL